MGTPRSHIKIAHSATRSNRELDNYPQKESGGRLLSEEESEWVEYTDNWVEKTPPRKLGTRRAVRAANTSRKLGSVPSFPKPQHIGTHENPDKTRDIVLRALFEGAKSGGQYVLSILKTVSHLARWPIAFCIASFLSMIMMSHISKAFGRAFEPLCIIPGISSISACNPGHGTSLSTNSGGNLTPKWADYSRLMDVQMQSFEQLLGDVVGGSVLFLEIKKAEIATTDLITHIRVSDLEAKGSLAMSLSEFAEDAKKVGRSLQKLTSKVSGAIDNIMTVNTYALQSIADVRESEPHPWTLRSIVSWAAPTQQINEVVMRTFNEAMNVFVANMERLIVEGERNIHHLINLEERLATMHEVVVCEDLSISFAKSDLLASLWTKLGGNRKSLRKHEYHLLLLKGWGVYRMQALTHIAAALHIVYAMGEDLEDMRERMGTPHLFETTVPVEAYIKSIQMGLERLPGFERRSREGKGQKGITS